MTVLTNLGFSSRPLLETNVKLFCLLFHHDTRTENLRERLKSVETPLEKEKGKKEELNKVK